MKQVITKEEVGKAISDLVGQGKKATLAAVHAALGNRGSMSTLVRLKAEIEAAVQPTSDSSEGLRAFHEVWALAVEEGKKQQEAVVMELHENLKALATENERLEGIALAAQNQAAELEQAKSKTEAELKQIKNRTDDELNQAKTTLTEATAQAADALQKLAAVQASYATEIGTLQADLAAAVQSAHSMELKLVRSNALLEANGINPEAPASRKGKQIQDK